MQVTIVGQVRAVGHTDGTDWARVVVERASEQHAGNWFDLRMAFPLQWEPGESVEVTVRGVCRADAKG